MEEKIIEPFEMDCFQWKKRVSDFLDKKLPSDLKQKAEEHLEECRECADTYKHYQIIIQTLSQLPHHDLPAVLRERPFNAPLLEKPSREMRISFWDKLPWGARIFFQWTAMMGFILCTLFTAPFLHRFYEKKLKIWIREVQAHWENPENRLMQDKEWVPPVFSQAKVPQMSVAPESVPPEEEEGGIVAEESDLDLGGKFKGLQLWRFMIQTVNPEEIRSQVSLILKDQIQLDGIKVPGGIEFDFILDQEKVPSLKKQLESLPSSRPGDFSWYRVPSKKELPPEKAQVVVWIFQSN